MERDTRLRSKLFYFFIFTGLIAALLIGGIGLVITLGNQQKINEGTVGEQGLQGPQGPPGQQGIKGDTGPRGPIGEKGAIGLRGPIGLSALEVVNRWRNIDEQAPFQNVAEWQASLKGAQGNPGKDGKDGAQGAQGNPGPQGVPGMTPQEVRNINEQADKAEKAADDVKKLETRWERTVVRRLNEDIAELRNQINELRTALEDKADKPAPSGDGS